MEMETLLAKQKRSFAALAIFNCFYHKYNWTVAVFLLIFLILTLLYEYQESSHEETKVNWLSSNSINYAISPTTFVKYNEQVSSTSFIESTNKVIVETSGITKKNRNWIRILLNGSINSPPITTTVSPSTKAAITSTTTTAKNEIQLLPSCPQKPPGLLGHISVSFASEAYEVKQIEEENPLVLRGGFFKPPICKSLSKVAIIIPFRDRDEHLRYFLQYMHPILQRQQLEYRVYIINQYGTGKFNRAKLMNIGYSESIKDHDFGCFVFHDVDLILENDFAIYSCPEQPRHLSVGVDKFNYKLPYVDIFGGVTELTRKQFQDINGYSNSFWGWGGEDDDMSARVRLHGMTISRYPDNISKYRMISHGHDVGNEPNPQRFDLIRRTSQTMRTDGLNTLKYEVVNRDDNSLYTNITVNVFGPN